MQSHANAFQRSSFLIAALLAATLCTPPLAFARPPAHVEPRNAKLDPAENHRRVTWTLQLVSSIGTTVVASMTAVGLGLSSGVLATSHDDDSSDFNSYLLDDRGVRTFRAVTGVSALLLVPPAAALGVHGVGRRRGQQGSYRDTVLYSLAGGLGVFALTFMVSWPALSIDHQAPALGAVALAGGISTLGFVGGAMYGHPRTVEHAPAGTGRGPRLLPGLNVSERALSLSVHGTF